MGPEIASPFPSDVFNEFGSLVQILISGGSGAEGEEEEEREPL